MNYNLNCPVKVRLTIKGIEIMQKYFYDDIKRCNLPFKEFHIPETDKDGWTKFDQAVEIFEIFGGHSWLCNEPFAMEVKFED